MSSRPNAGPVPSTFMRGFLHRLLARGPLLTDGAWGTQLQARGLGIGEFPDSWNLLHPDRVEEVARAYIDAGSRIILTNTFGANRLRLAGHALAEQVAEINRLGVDLSRTAARTRGALVFASMGPTGRMLMTGDTSAEEMEAAFVEQARALAGADPDAIVVETMSDLEEAQWAVKAAKSTGLPVVASVVFDSGRDRDRTMMGQTPEQVATALVEAGADAVGANCGQGIAGFIGICVRMQAVTDRPIWIKPNAGLPELVDGQALYRTSPEDFASHVPALLAAGASFIGGCCGTSPEYIRAMAAHMPAPAD